MMSETASDLRKQEWVGLLQTGSSTLGHPWVAHTQPVDKGVDRVWRAKRLSGVREHVHHLAPGPRTESVAYLTGGRGLLWDLR